MPNRPQALVASNALDGRTEMKLYTYSSSAISRFRKLPGLLALGLLFALAFAGNALAAQAPVPLGTASSFAVLAHTGVTDTAPNSTINGDLGNDQLIPTTGTPNLNGASHVGDGVAAGARADLNTAIGFASGAALTTAPLPSGTLSGTLAPGVYTSGGFTMNLPGVVTLDAGGDPSAVWIFKATSDLITAGSVNLIGGASPCNVFWQVTSSATLNGSSFVGTILASDSVTIGSGVSLSGRALAYTGDVTMMNDSISTSECSASSGGGSQPPPREIYCTPAGVAYDLVAGQDKLPPYNLLGLIPAYVDPVTGSKSCTFPAAIVPIVPTPVVPTPVTPTPVTPTPKLPTPAQKAAAVAKAKAAAAATKKAAAVKAAKKKAAAKAQAKKAKPGAPPKTATGGFTG
jgi:Ice-binding-like